WIWHFQLEWPGHAWRKPLAMARLLLLGTALAQRPTPRWHGGVEVLAQDPPIFLLRNFMSSAEAERLMLDYDVELIPEFVSHANSSGSPVQDRCLQRFPASFCSSVPAEGHVPDECGMALELGVRDTTHG
ncbi:unnamed protein product, partial [Effrenium voratum]